MSLAHWRKDALTCITGLVPNLWKVLMFRVGLNTEQVAGGYWGTGDRRLDKDRRG